MSKSKKNKAVALKYNVEEDTSPVVIASGYGTVAEKIIDIAEKKGIPVFKDDSAASLLCMLEVGSNIPVELYEVVAAIYCKLLETSAKLKSQEAIAKAETTEPRGRNLVRTRSAGTRDRSSRRGKERGTGAETGSAGVGSGRSERTVTEAGGTQKPGASKNPGGEADKPDKTRGTSEL